MAYYAGFGAGTAKLARLAGEQKICVCFDARRRGKAGLARRRSLMELELDLGFRSSFNFIQKEATASQLN